MSAGRHALLTDQASWDDHYRSMDQPWNGQPNPQLMTETVDLPAGRALDIGSGDGADALWLAERGWLVVGVDFATVAIERASARLAAAGLADRVAWVHADVQHWVPPPGQFDLVTSHFLHLPAESRQPTFARLVAAVAPGGTLLVVGHSASDIEAGAYQPDVPQMFFTAEEIAASLDPVEWEIVVADTHQRATRLHETDHGIAVADAVLRAHRRG